MWATVSFGDIKVDLVREIQVHRAQLTCSAWIALYKFILTLKLTLPVFKGPVKGMILSEFYGRLSDDCIGPRGPSNSRYEQIPNIRFAISFAILSSYGRRSCRSCKLRYLLLACAINYGWHRSLPGCSSINHTTIAEASRGFISDSCASLYCLPFLADDYYHQCAIFIRYTIIRFTVDALRSNIAAELWNPVVYCSYTKYQMSSSRHNETRCCHCIDTVSSSITLLSSDEGFITYMNGKSISEGDSIR